ncbi:MAG: DUF1638 domain-containing protein [Zhaonellaceae bacterium]|jgi:hypothetical protein|nr:DUF1638 domain-containing protein [Clostridia bacterium]
MIKGDEYIKKFFCCEIFKDILEGLTLPDDLKTSFVRKELHRSPEKLHAEIQQLLNETNGYELIILGFGLCGNALNDIKTTNCPVIMPRIHDCVPVFLGSKAKYETLHKENMRTFYYVSSMDMVREDYERSLAKYGLNKSKRLFAAMFKNYNRFLYIHTNNSRNNKAYEEVQNFASIVELPCDEIKGSLDYLEKLINGPWDKEQFITIPPFSTIKMGEFM